jgi:formate/nitrite transporter
MPEVFGSDAYSPREIAQRVEAVGVVKARLPLLSMVMLGMLAGAFVGMGAMFSIIVTADTSLSFGVARVLGGAVFSLGLLLVVVAGAELFTGNNLLAMAWADGKVTSLELLRNWAVVCAANFAGAAGLALLVFLSGHTDMNGGAIAAQVLKLAQVKCDMPLAQAFFKGVLCNLFVCMAVWMAMAGRSVVDKAVAVVPPITAFVAAGLEHSIANMYIIPLAMLLKASGMPAADSIGWVGMLHNLLPVIAGNIVGGSVLVALVYHLIYRRGADRDA